MALRRTLGFSDGELMRSDAKPCCRLMRQTAGIFSVGGALSFWILCGLRHGPRTTFPQSLRWAACGVVSMSTTTALLVWLFSPECKPQNIEAYDQRKYGSCSCLSMLLYETIQLEEVNAWDATYIDIINKKTIVQVYDINQVYELLNYQ